MVVFDLSVAEAEFFHLEKEKSFIHIVKCIGVKTFTEISVFIKSQHHSLKRKEIKPQTFTNSFWFQLE